MINPKEITQKVNMLQNLHFNFFMNSHQKKLWDASSTKVNLHSKIWKFFVNLNLKIIEKTFVESISKQYLHDTVHPPSIKKTLQNMTNLKIIVTCDKSFNP